MYCPYWNQSAAAYLSFYFFIFLSLQFSNIKIFRHTFLSNCEAKKVETCYTHGQSVYVSCIPESGCCSYSSLYFSFFFLFNLQRLKFFIPLFSQTVRPRRLKLVTHMDSGWMYHVYLKQAAALIHPFIFLSLQFSSIKKCSSHFCQEL